MHFCLDYYHHLHHLLIHIYNISIIYLLFFNNFFLYSIKLHISITISKSSALLINTLLIFDIQLINAAMFFNAKDLFFLFFLWFPSTVIILLTTLHASLKSHKSYCSMDVLNVICLLDLYIYLLHCQTYHEFLLIF